MSDRRFLVWFPIGVLALLCTASSGAQEAPLPTLHGLVQFGSLGLAKGQTLRLNLTRLPASPLAANPPDPVRVLFVFHDANGGVLAKSALRVKPGASASADFSAELLPKGLPRAQIHATIRVAGEEPGLPPGPICATLELIEVESARTTVILNPGLIRGFNPQPDPPLEAQE